MNKDRGTTKKHHLLAFILRLILVVYISIIDSILIGGVLFIINVIVSYKIYKNNIKIKKYDKYEFIFYLFILVVVAFFDFFLAIIIFVIAIEDKYFLISNLYKEYFQ